MHTTIIAILSLILFIDCSLSPAMASSDFITVAQWKDLVYRLLTLAGFIGIIAYFFGKKITGFFHKRTESIETELRSLEQRKVDAEQMLHDIEKRISNLEEERQAILAEYTSQGEAIKAHILLQAEDMAAQITEQARKTAENEITSAIMAMRTEMAEHIVAATEQLLAKKLSVEEQSKLVDTYLKKVVLH